jgi:hypothetical protein
MDETREEIINNETEDTKDVQTAETAVQEPEKKKPETDTWQDITSEDVPF